MTGQAAQRIETMWCTSCGARFTDDEIKGWGCPKCGNQGVPCGTAGDVRVEVNWHELHILCVWAENFASQCDERKIERSGPMVPVVHAIARRLQLQHPTLGHLTLGGEIAALPADLAKAGIEVGKVEAIGITKPPLFQVNGPGAVGHTKETQPCR